MLELARLGRGAARRRPGGRARDARATPTASALRPSTRVAKRDLRAADAATSDPRRARAAARGGRRDPRDDVLSALDRATVRGDAAGEPGRVAVLDLTRARTRSFEAVFVIGLEQGSLPRRAPTSPFFDDETRRELDAARGARLQRPDAASRDRYLFYTACTRPRTLLDARARGGHRRRLAARGEPVLGGGVRALRPGRRAPPHDEAAARAADLADRVGADGARAAARARPPRGRAIRARPTRSRSRTAGSASSAARRRAFSRPTAIRHPRAVALLASRETFRVTDLERMAGCSSAWFVERYLRPGGIDQAIDPMMRGSIAHVALQRFYRQLPSAIPGAERVTPEQRRGGRRAHAPLRRRRARLGPAHRRRRPAAPRARAGPAARPRAARAGRGRRELDVRAAQARGVVQGLRARARAWRSAARSIASTSTRSARAGSSSTTSRARRRRRRRSTTRRACRSRSTCSCCATGSASSRWAASTCRSAAAAAPRGMLRAGDEQVPGFAAGDYLDGPEFEAEIEHARARGGRAGRADPRRATSSTTRAAATARPGATSGACAARSGRERQRRVRRRLQPRPVTAPGAG